MKDKLLQLANECLDNPKFYYDPNLILSEEVIDVDAMDWKKKKLHIFTGFGRKYDENMSPTGKKVKYSKSLIEYIPIVEIEFGLIKSHISMDEFNGLVSKHEKNVKIMKELFVERQRLSDLEKIDQHIEEYKNDKIQSL